MVNALKRVLKQGENVGVTADAATRERFPPRDRGERARSRGYEQRIAQYREAIENGRVQSGFGDQRYIDDDQARRRFSDVLNREAALCAAGQDSGDAAEYARSIQPILARADAIDLRLDGTRADLERNATAQADALRVKIADELASVETRAPRSIRSIKRPAWSWARSR
jgi:hypothetical protein